MIDYIKGKCSELSPTRVVIETAGVGYELNISLTTYSSIEGKEEVRLYVYENIREDAWVLFGFATKEERELFFNLITVSGIGGNTARSILSSYSTSELVAIIANKQVDLLKAIKGIGAKTAQRIVVELADKVKDVVLPEAVVVSAEQSRRNGALSPSGEEAVAALTMLGFAPAPSKKVVLKLLEADKTLSAEALIKKALKMM
ncbi:MAG: Holliday junction branch migration protein RuvA [Bacteroidaceae bacterium]|nr:Holliday junction branch migration protein RuvA [Bacteroidaceae bacterium]